MVLKAFNLKVNVPKILGKLDPHSKKEKQNPNVIKCDITLAFNLNGPNVIEYTTQWALNKITHEVIGPKISCNRQLLEYKRITT